MLWSVKTYQNTECKKSYSHLINTVRLCLSKYLRCVQMYSFLAETSILKTIQNRDITKAYSIGKLDAIDYNVNCFGSFKFMGPSHISLL